MSDPVLPVVTDSDQNLNRITTAGIAVYSGCCMNLELKQRFFWEVIMGSFSKPITPLMGGIRNTLRFNPPIMEG